MKAKFIQRVLTAALTASLVAAPCLGVFASESDPKAPGSDQKETGSAEESMSAATVEEEVVQIVNQIVAANNSGGGSVSSVAQIPVTSSVAGVKSTVKGVYLATSVNGTAITTSVANIASGYGLKAGETPSARIYNMSVKKSPLAAAAIDNAAAAMGATVGPYVNVELGKLSGGKFSLLPSEGAPITLKFGIPRAFAQSGKTFAVICVRPGGAVSVLQDTDDNPDTVTFDTTGGQGAYAIVKY